MKMLYELPESSFFRFLKETNPEVYKRAIELLGNESLLDALNSVADFYQIPRPDLTDPIAGTLERMKAQIAEVIYESPGSV